MIEIQLNGRTDVGQVREHNEDSFVMVHLDDDQRDGEKLRVHDEGEKGTLLVVCDGMGGAAAGEVASSMAVDAIANMMLSDAKFAPPEGVTDDAKQSLARKLREAARDANQRIFREARENIARAGMGTTMTAALLWKKEALIAQVGDSRCYVWRAGKFTQVTRDQSLVNQLLESGHITAEQAKFFEHSNVILQALGVQDEVEVQLSRVSLRKGDRFMLCSDGLVGVVTDEEIGEIVGSVADPAETSRILIEMANAAGGPDNITVIVAHVGGDLEEPTAADEIKYELWRIEPEPPPLEITVEPSSQTFADDDTQEAPSAEPLPAKAPSAPAHNPTLELVSMAVVVGLIVGSLVTGAALYQQAVPCTVEAPSAGLMVVADGRSAGVSTVEAGNGGAAELRLHPGHHQLSLKGVGAPDEIQEVEVQKGGACSFKIPQRGTQQVKLVIEIVGGARKGARLEFDDPQSLKFGRHPSCEVAFDPEQDRDASSRHAELRREGAIFCLYDLDSANGTVVDGRPVMGRTPVAPGAEIEFGAGGPRCRVHYVGVAATVPPTMVKPGARAQTPQHLGHRTVAVMIEDALKRARAGGRTRVVLSAVVAAVVVGAAAVIVGLRMRARRAPSGAEIARQNRDAVFLVSVKSGTGDEAGFCSAFAIQTHRLVTNAHCVALAEDYRRRGGQLFVIQNGHPAVRFPVKQMKRIEGFRPNADSITPDVGWFSVDDTLPANVKLAERGEYQALAVGDNIYSYGFPGRLADVMAPEATFMEGVIGRITTLDGRSGQVSDTRLIQHSAFTSGGTSGSPIFDTTGHVVAVNTGGYVEAGQGDSATRPLPGYNFAMRVDMVEELLKGGEQ